MSSPEWSDIDDPSPPQLPDDDEPWEVARNFVRLHPGGPLALTPRMAMKLNIAAVVLAEQDEAFRAISEHIETGRLPPVAAKDDKQNMRHVLKVAREWDADGLFDSKYCHYDDLKLLPAMPGDRDFDAAAKILLYLRPMRDRDEKRRELTMGTPLRFTPHPASA